MKNYENVKNHELKRIKMDIDRLSKEINNLQTKLNKIIKSKKDGKNWNYIKLKHSKTNEILTFNNTNDMANYLNVSKQSIYNLISGKTKSLKQYNLINISK